jgi:hypothetical protein
LAKNKDFGGTEELNSVRCAGPTKRPKHGLYKRLVAVAGADRRSTSNVVELLIEQGLPAYEARLAIKK